MSAEKRDIKDWDQAMVSVMRVMDLIFNGPLGDVYKFGLFVYNEDTGEAHLQCTEEDPDKLRQVLKSYAVNLSEEKKREVSSEPDI